MNGSSSSMSALTSENFAALVRETVADVIVDEPGVGAEITSAKSFFNGDTLLDLTKLKSEILTNGGKMAVKIRKRQSLLSPSLVANADVDRVTIPTDVDTAGICHDRVDIPCFLPCLSPTPEFDQVEVCIDKIWVTGAHKCVVDQVFWDETEYTRQVALGRRALAFQQELALWNKVMGILINSPASTVGALASCQELATHFWDNQGDITQTGREQIIKAYQYLTSAFGAGYKVLMSPDAATALLNAFTGVAGCCPNDSQVVIDPLTTNVIPGYNNEASVASAVSRLLGGIPVMILSHNPELDDANGTTLYPLWASDMSALYVAIVKPEVGYFVEIRGGELTERPYSCENALYEGVTYWDFSASGVTFKTLGLVLSFDFIDIC